MSQAEKVRSTDAILGKENMPLAIKLSDIISVAVDIVSEELIKDFFIRIRNNEDLDIVKGSIVSHFPCRHDVRKNFISYIIDTFNNPSSLKYKGAVSDDQVREFIIKKIQSLKEYSFALSEAEIQAAITFYANSDIGEAAEAAIVPDVLKDENLEAGSADDDLDEILCLGDIGES